MGQHKPPKPRKTKRQQIKALIEIERLMQKSASEMLETLEEPKYPASTVTEAQRARWAKYRKSFQNALNSSKRRLAKLERDIA